MKNRRVTAPILGALVILFGLAPPAIGTSLMENLGRGVVAVRTSATTVFVGWRVLGTDPSDVAFDLYRSTAATSPVKLNAAPLSGPTSFVDTTADPSLPNAYFVRAIFYGIEQPPSAAFTLPANAPVQPYLRVPLQLPAPGVTPLGQTYTYHPNDLSVGDLDGDGEYEIVVKWEPSNAQDNSNPGLTGEVYLDAYTLGGSRMWRINLGRNIRAGAHYTQFQVYDLDGDGKAEVACKTADGTVDGVGNVIGDANADWRDIAPHPVSGRIGYVLNGPEFLTVFSGQTGAALATAPYVVPRDNVADWGDNYGNRVDRFLAGIAYLDGQRPSLVMARGYYTRTVLAAWNWRDGAFTNIWTFDTGHTGATNSYSAYRGQGNHNLSIGDVDGDGRDEIMYGAMAVDDDGTGLFTTGLGHGDALHMSDMDPDRPGLEVFQPHESPSSYGPNGLELRDARTGGLIFGVQATGDIGRGLALDVDPRYRGYEMWGSGDTGGMYSAQRFTPNAALGNRGVQISPSKPSINYGVWWDGDTLRELLDGTVISKWDWLAGTAATILAPAGVASNNGTKANPGLSADILGDWREEVIWRESTNDALRIYISTIPTTHRFYTLMHDRQYRAAIAWQNTGYNQPPHPSFFLGDGMAQPPVPDIVTSLSVLLGPPAPVFTSIASDTGASSTDSVTSDSTLVLSGTATSGTTVTVTRFGVGIIGTALTDGSGNWALDYGAVTLPDGVSNYIATATDSNGITGAASPPFAITVDTAAPAAAVLESIARESGSLVFEGTAEPGSAVTVTHVGLGAVGTAPANAAGAWRLAYAGPPLPAGSHAFTAAAADLAGNTGPDSTSVSVNTAIAAPVITAIDADTGASTADGITSDVTLVLMGAADPGDTVSLARAGTIVGSTVADGAGNWFFDHTGTPLPGGSYSFRATSGNSFGVSPSSPAFLVTIDTTAPTVVAVTRQSPTAAVSSAATIVFRVTFNETVTGVDAGDFTLTFLGGLSGAISNLSSGGAFVDVTVGPLMGEGSVRLDVNATGIVDVAGTPLAGGFIGGETYTRALQGNGTWTRSTTGGAWNDHANWQDGIVGSGIGTIAAFNTLELTDDVSVLLDAPQTVGGLLFGDTEVNTTGSWLVDDGGNPGNVLTLAVTAGTPTVTVNPMGPGAVTTLATALDGTAGFNKLGLGQLVLTRPNPIRGAVNVSGGIVRLDSGSVLDTGTGAVNVGTAGGTEIRIDGGSFTAGGLVTLQNGLLTVNSGTVALAAARTNSDFGSTYRVNGGTFSAASIEIRRNSAGTPDFNSGFIITGGSATVTGPIRLGTANSNGALSISGGSLVAVGPITIGNQVTGGRGGAMRVLGGTFTSTNTAEGIILARNPGTQPNNVASATFTGGTSTVEKFTLGFDAAVTAGSATITLNGGTLYLGAGGIVKNGAAGLVTNLNFSSGTLGAHADWSTTLPITLPTGGNIAFKATDAGGAPKNIALLGPLSGGGGFTKTGAGTLILGGASTFTGLATVAGGTLVLAGTLAPTSTMIVGGDGTLTGTGSAGAMVLGAGGTIVPGGGAPGSMLRAGSLTWSNGGRIAFDLDAGNQLALTGALLKGGGTGEVVLSAAAPLTVGGIHTLATFASTDFAASDFVFSGLADYRGLFLMQPTKLQFLVTGIGPTAEYTHWTYTSGLPEGQRAATDDPDNDGIANLLEFATASDPLRANPQALTVTTVEEAGVVYPAVRFIRRVNPGGVTTNVLVSPTLDFLTSLGSVEVSASSMADGTELVVVRSAASLAAQPTQFFRLTAALP
jgi:autotransporter-associated beta strand protein